MFAIELSTTNDELSRRFIDLNFLILLISFCKVTQSLSSLIQAVLTLLCKY